MTTARDTESAPDAASVVPDAPPWEYHETDDDSTIRTWRSRQNFAPVRGENGGGGFIGWANRLDNKVNDRSGGKLFKREPQVPIRQGELWHEIFHRPLLYWTVLWLAFVVAVIAADLPLAGVIGVLPFLAISAKARSRLRERRLNEIRQELDAGPTAPVSLRT